MHVAAYVEELTRSYAAPTVKQRHNPAAAVRGPKHVVTKGKTPVKRTASAPP